MLRKFLDNVEKQILSNNKLKKFHPLYDALDTFLYSPNTQTQEAPYVRDAIDLKRTMIIVVLALLPSSPLKSESLLGILDDRLKVLSEFQIGILLDRKGWRADLNIIAKYLQKILKSLNMENVLL